MLDVLRFDPKVVKAETRFRKGAQTSHREREKTETSAQDSCKENEIYEK